MQETDVLICGAGPTGLALALWLTKKGVKVRLVDKTAGPGTTSRALVFHARNLEFYHQMGIDGIAIEKGIEFKAANLWVAGAKRGRVQFGDPSAEESPYPYALILPQDEHERMLIAVLEGLGVYVERNTEVLSYEDSDKGITAQIKHADGTVAACTARYLAGCDGAHSMVRKSIAADFPGGTYAQMFYVADLQVSGPVANGEMQIALDDADFLAIFPMKGEGRVRLVGAIKHDEKDNKDLQWEDVRQGIIDKMPMKVEGIKWFSTYRVHHRVASHFSKGNAFLLGDAGHLHSPVGGQGMNTGIGDAINLAWKLAAVIKQHAAAALPDTYEPERIAFARWLVATTDSAFTFINKTGFVAAEVRTRLAPHVLPLLFRMGAVRRGMFRILSQTRISYEDSPLSAGKAGELKGGDRLPWVPHIPGSAAGNYESLTSMDWQVHCYGTAHDGLQRLCTATSIPLHVYDWTDEMNKKGLKKDAAYIIRPDGYVGIAATGGDADSIAAYFERWGIGLQGK